MGEYWNLDRLTQEWEARGLSRRDLMKLIGAGAGGAAITTIMKHDAALAQDAQPGRIRRRSQCALASAGDAQSALLELGQ